MEPTFPRRPRVGRIILPDASYVFPLGLRLCFMDHYIESLNRTYAHRQEGECRYCSPMTATRLQSVGWACRPHVESDEARVMIVSGNAFRQLADRLDVTRAFVAEFRRVARLRYRPLEVVRCRPLSMDFPEGVSQAAHDMLYQRIGALLYPSDLGSESETWASVFWSHDKNPAFSRLNRSLD